MHPKQVATLPSLMCTGGQCISGTQLIASLTSCCLIAGPALYSSWSEPSRLASPYCHTAASAACRNCSLPPTPQLHDQVFFLPLFLPDGFCCGCCGFSARLLACGVVLLSSSGFAICSANLLACAMILHSSFTSAAVAVFAATFSCSSPARSIAACISIGLKTLHAPSNFETYSSRSFFSSASLTPTGVSSLLSWAALLAPMISR